MNQKLIQTVISECHRIEEDALYSSKSHYNVSDRWAEVSRRFSVLLRRTFPDYELDGTREPERKSTSAAGRPPEECALLFGEYSGTTDDVFRI